MRGDASPLALAGWQMVLGGLLLFVWGAAAGGAPGPWGARELALIVALAAIGSAAPLALFYRSLTRAPAAEVSAWFFLVPVVGVLLAWPFLGERPSASLAVGMVAVSLGLWLVLGRRGPSPAGEGARP